MDVAALKHANYPDHFLDLLQFLCNKYGVDRSQVFVDYSSNPPPPLKGGRAGYYDGLLSFREKDGRPEFLITVFSVARDPLLTLAHEFAHLVNDLTARSFDKKLEPPDESSERSFDDNARRDIAEFKSSHPFNHNKRNSF